MNFLCKYMLFLFSLKTVSFLLEIVTFYAICGILANRQSAAHAKRNKKFILDMAKSSWSQFILFWNERFCSCFLLPEFHCQLLFPNSPPIHKHSRISSSYLLFQGNLFWHFSNKMRFISIYIYTNANIFAYRQLLYMLIYQN